METIEFRVSPDGNVYFSKNGGTENRLTRFNKELCGRMIQIISNRFPGAWSRLRLLYPPKSNSAADKDISAFQIVERFIRCNFGELDTLSPDMANDILNFEEVRCPLRGVCKDENIICKPQSLTKLSPAEKEVVQLYLYGYTFTEIARRLGKAPQTVKVQLHNIKNKLETKNCREIIKVMRLNTL